MTSTSDSAASLPQQLREEAARFEPARYETDLRTATLLRSAADALERADRQLAEVDAAIAWLRDEIADPDEMKYAAMALAALTRHASRQGAPQTKGDPT